MYLLRNQAGPGVRFGECHLAAESIKRLDILSHSFETPDRPPTMLSDGEGHRIHACTISILLKSSHVRRQESSSHQAANRLRSPVVATTPHP
jgi:hypothetical protein